MAKKKRKMRHSAAEDIIALPRRDLISTLPWELIAEILAAASPKDVLALARCSRHFCNSLVMNPRSKCIWEGARKHCNPPVPDPTPNFTEPAYASYIFDGGPCEECGKFTELSYTSFSLRLRFCKYGCYSDWVRKNAVYERTNDWDSPVRSWLMSSEGERHHFEVDSRRFFRKSDFDRALQEYRSFLGPSNRQEYKRGVYCKLHENDAKRKEAILLLSSELLAWMLLRSVVAKSVKTGNLKLLAKIADDGGWRVNDILNSPTCMALYRRHKSANECFTERDFNAVRANIEAEVTKIIEKRARSQEEQAYARRRSLVELDYHRRRSIDPSRPDFSVLPTLSVFREQPVIKSMQNKQGSRPEDVSRRLDDPSVGGMIEDNLSVWRDQAMNAFMKILGVKKYYAVNPKKLHPVDRLTARFLCKVCLRHSSDETSATPLDFREACTHECRHLTKKQKMKMKWSPDQFQCDRKAMNVTRKLLDLSRTPEDDNISLALMEDTRDRILCKTCDCKIVMNFKAMQRHSHRHEDMDIRLLVKTEAKELNLSPVHWGLCAELTSMAKSAPRKAELRMYGCRHCLQADVSAKDSLAAGDVQADGKKSSSKGQKFKADKLMSFYGLRCHALQRHGISRIADEDVYSVSAGDAPL